MGVKRVIGKPAGSDESFWSLKIVGKPRLISGKNAMDAASLTADERPIGPPPAAETSPQQLHQRIGQLAEAEHRLRAVVDNVIDGIITISEGATIESFNPAARRFSATRTRR